MVQLFRYQRKDGSEPFTDWLANLRDKVAQARVRLRLLQLEMGNFGDVKPVGGGVSELRIHVGAGYRVYFGQHGKAIVILLSGGDKNRQDSDIRQAKEFWEDWKGRQR